MGVAMPFVVAIVVYAAFRVTVPWVWNLILGAPETPGAASAQWGVAMTVSVLASAAVIIAIGRRTASRERAERQAEAARAATRARLPR